MNTRTLLALGTLAALALTTRPAAAQYTWYPNDATINYTVSSGYADVGYSSYGNYSSKTNPTSPTVNVVPGALISGYLVGFNHSTVNVSGGQVQTYIFAHDNSTFNITGGTVRATVAYENSVVNASSMTSTMVMEANNSSTMTISGGTYGSTNGVNFIDHTTGSFTFVGTGLSAVSIGGDATYGGTDYKLTGLLQDGNSVTGKVINVARGARMFTLSAAPEPSAFAALGLGALSLSGLTWRARRRGKPTA